MPSLSLTKSFSVTNKAAYQALPGAAFDDVVPGARIDFEVFYTNIGNDVALNSSFTDSLPPGIVFMSNTISITTNGTTTSLSDEVDADSGTFDVTSNEIRILLPRVPRHASGRIRYRVVVK